MKIALIGYLQVGISRFGRRKETKQFIGAPGEIRTPDRSVRSRVLYPAELRAHITKRAIITNI